MGSQGAGGPNLQSWGFPLGVPPLIICFDLSNTAEHVSVTWTLPLSNQARALSHCCQGHLNTALMPSTQKVLKKMRSERKRGGFEEYCLSKAGINRGCLAEKCCG